MSAGASSSRGERSRAGERTKNDKAEEDRPHQSSIISMDAVATPVDDNVNVSAPSASALPEAVIEPDIPVEESSAVYDPSNPPM